MKAKRVEVCGHGSYFATVWDGLKECTCRKCGHKWITVLKPDGTEASE